jgi:hypothetical protein
VSEDSVGPASEHTRFTGLEQAWAPVAHGEAAVERPPGRVIVGIEVVPIDRPTVAFARTVIVPGVAETAAPATLDEAIDQTLSLGGAS